MVACRILFSFLGERRQARDEWEGRVRGGAPSSCVSRACLPPLAWEKKCRNKLTLVLRASLIMISWYNTKFSWPILRNYMLARWEKYDSDPRETKTCYSKTILCVLVENADIFLNSSDYFVYLIKHDGHSTPLRITRLRLVIWKTFWLRDVLSWVVKPWDRYSKSGLID